MKFLVSLSLLLISATTAMAQDQTINLESNQSMAISGKGPGQDGAINPYYGQDSVAIVSNMGENTFSVRIQKKGKIIKEVSIAAAQTKEIFLAADQELYFDSDLAAKTAIRFRKADQ